MFPQLYQKVRKAYIQATYIRVEIKGRKVQIR